MNSKKRVTMRDIAREANVSIATVSYVLNGKETEKISEETERKVWQIVNMLGYQPNRTARMLATGKSDAVGICVRPDGAWDIAVAQAIARRVFERGKRVVLLSGTEREALKEVDAIFAVNLPHETFLALSEYSFVPLIGVDTLPNNWLFYQICDDIDALAEKARAILGTEELLFVTANRQNAPLREFLAEAFEPDHTHFLSDFEWLHAFLNQHPAAGVLALGSEAALLCQHRNCVAAVHDAHMLPPQMPRILLSALRKADAALAAMDAAIAREDGREHNVVVC